MLGTLAETTETTRRQTEAAAFVLTSTPIATSEDLEDTRAWTEDQPADVSPVLALPRTTEANDGILELALPDDPLDEAIGDIVDEITEAGNDCR